MLSSDKLKGTAWVQTKRLMNGLDGETVKVGTKVNLPLAMAHEAVHNGSADWCEAPKAKSDGEAGGGK